MINMKKMTVLALFVMGFGIASQVTADGAPKNWSEMAERAKKIQKEKHLSRAPLLAPNPMAKSNSQNQSYGGMLGGGSHDRQPHAVGTLVGGGSHDFESHGSQGTKGGRGGVPENWSEMAAEGRKRGLLIAPNPMAKGNSQNQPHAVGTMVGGGSHDFGPHTRG